MATIREVVEALSRRTGVDAVVVVGRDGLPIDSRTANGVDAESVAALLPSVINGMTQLGQASGRGDFGTGVLEFGAGLALVSVLNVDALLVVLVQPSTNVGAMLYDLRRHRSAIAGLLCAGGARVVAPPAAPPRRRRRAAHRAAAAAPSRAARLPGGPGAHARRRARGAAGPPRTARRAAARSPSPRRLGARPAAGAARRRRHASSPRHRADRRRRRAGPQRGGGAGRRPVDQALQPQQAHRAHRRHAGTWARTRGRAVSVWAAILAGGSGTRFWPLSTPERPKQLLPLAGDRPLLQQAVERLDGLVPPERILILTGPFLVDQVAHAVPQIPRAQVLAEPRAASTAPALVWAAHWISERDSGAQLLSLHADWAVEDDRAFRAAARQALAVADEYDVLVTVGVKPTRNETAYGYIVPSKPLGDARGVRRFVEKPSPARAALLRQRGALWNTGLFAWGVARFLGEAGAYARELKPGWPALAAGDIAGFFGAVRPVAVDVAVLERTKRLAVVAGSFRWDDIGSWDALLRIRKPDPHGNVVVGNVTLADDVRRSVVWSDSEHLAVIGLEDMVVVRANGHTLVMPTGRAERLKQLVQRL